MRRLSLDEINNARQTLAEHTAAVKPTHTDTSKLNDWTATASRWNGATANINTAVVLEEEKRLGRDLTFAEKKQLSAAKG